MTKWTILEYSLYGERFTGYSSDRSNRQIRSI